jgi:Carboxypeptidase regulatory-like domain
MKALAAAALASLLAIPALAAEPQAKGSLSGRVTDPQGGAIRGAAVTATGPTTATARSDAQGAYAFGALPPGRYSLSVVKAGFARREAGPVDVSAQRPASLDVRLELAPVTESVTVKSETSGLSLSPEESAGAIVIKGADLDALPDDPDEMAEALQALAGPAAGPNGGQIFVDGFTGGRIPPKSSIREIRLNSNPFSAEYDRPGFGRIEIFTKPGTDQLRGEAAFRFADAALDTRNPFATNDVPYQRRDWSGNLSGPLAAKKGSFFVDFDERHVDDNALVNATVLGPDLSEVPLQRAVLTPQTRTTVSPRVDWQLGEKHTLSLRYTYTSTSHDLAGVGGFSLPSRGYSTSGRQQTFQLSETSTWGKLVNETHARYWSERQSQNGDDSLPTLQVQDAFTSGGSGVGPSFDEQHRFELQNVSSWTLGQHAIRAGFRLRSVSLDDVARNGFGGSVVFTGDFGPELDANDQLVLGANGRPVIVGLTSLERYRRSVLFQELGLSGAQIRALGGGPSQLQIVGGNPEATLSQWDIAPFVQDDWRVSADLLLSLGLRYELQDNIDSRLNLAPRAGLAWSLGRKDAQGRAGTVLRAGFGVFYDRFDESNTLRARRYDGVELQQYLVTDPALLDALRFSADGTVSGLPPLDSPGLAIQPQATWRVAPSLQSPVTLQTSVSLEQQLPGNFTASLLLSSSQVRRLLRSRNVNAPLPDGTRPLGDAAGDVYQMESTGRMNQYHVILGINNRLSRKLTLFFRYFLAWARSDTDGVTTFPADSYDLSSEYGRAAIDVRQRLVLGGNLNLPWGVHVSPFILASSGKPFNITLGPDLNQDSLFTDRPAFATDPSAGSVSTAYGLFDVLPAPGQALIPRNYGEGPGFFSVNLRLSKTFTLPGRRGTGGPSDGGGRGPRGRGPGGGGFAGRGGGRGREGGESGGRTLTLSVSVQNLFNRVNLAAPVGNLSSPSFGESLATAGSFGFGAQSDAGNRRVELQARVSF